ncbi:MAG: ribosomal L7Ae/L30e/S12e/Gadd45 family protein [Clostridia bacterium]|nr:ribosomal L7Ae/L30e/S12e/Gadd45 family protein [Clostridia bacterium]
MKEIKEVPRSKRIIGTKQTKKEVVMNRVKKVYVAKDAENHIIRELTELCNEKLIPIIYVDTMKELGSICGIQVGAASAAILK